MTTRPTNRIVLHDDTAPFRNINKNRHELADYTAVCGAKLDASGVYTAPLDVWTPPAPAMCGGCSNNTSGACQLHGDAAGDDERACVPMTSANTCPDGFVGCFDLSANTHNSTTPNSRGEVSLDAISLAEIKNGKQKKLLEGCFWWMVAGAALLCVFAIYYECYHPECLECCDTNSLRDNVPCNMHWMKWHTFWYVVELAAQWRMSLHSPRTSPIPKIYVPPASFVFVSLRNSVFLISLYLVKCFSYPPPLLLHFGVRGFCVAPFPLFSLKAGCCSLYRCTQCILTTTTKCNAYLPLQCILTDHYNASLVRDTDRDAMLCACVLRYILVILIPAIVVFTTGARVLKHAKDINPSDRDGAVVRIAVAAALCVLFIPQLFRPLAELFLGCIRYAPKKWNERKLKRERAIELLAREAEFEETHSLVATAMSGDKYRLEKGWVATGADIHGMHLPHHPRLTHP